MTDKIINLYNSNIPIYKIATELKIGTKKVRSILHENSIDTSIRKSKFDFKLKSYKIEKYPICDGYHYVAIDKNNGFKTTDYNNKAGILTNHIKDIYGIDIPTLYERRKYYMETGNYWWEQWFNIEKQKNKPTKKCPYCGWETEDITNKSGAFEVHLKKKHNITKNDYLKEFPNDRGYFELVSSTLNRQMSTNPYEYVTCKICGKKLSRIDSKHLSLHGISKKDYIEMYGETISQRYHDMMSSAMTSVNMNMKHSFISAPEKELIDWLHSNGITAKRDRKILNGMEIDIFIPSLNTAIEFNGNKYHTEWFGGKGRQYHLLKTRGCKDKGVKLIHIFEDEYFFK